MSAREFTSRRHSESLKSSHRLWRGGPRSCRRSVLDLQVPSQRRPLHSEDAPPGGAHGWAESRRPGHRCSGSAQGDGKKRNTTSCVDRRMDFCYFFRLQQIKKTRCRCIATGHWRQCSLLLGNESIKDTFH